MKCLLAMVLTLLVLESAPAVALDAGMVWDVAHRCFRQKDGDGSSCGLTWHVDVRNYSGDEVKITPPETAKDIGARLDAQMATEQKQVETLQKNENVEKVRVLFTDEKMP
ncbi:MAG TPA: hypothetical protein DCW68_03725 [Rhodospirillaceae bacterium]|nr:MAG: hypothetical protein A2018_07805 [Alphaproteobacteria bacterium GWF2_58_20]HAU29203.1 hypothetical protein [Rhodospirillaceae bacterium]